MTDGYERGEFSNNGSVTFGVDHGAPEGDSTIVVAFAKAETTFRCRWDYRRGRMRLVERFPGKRTIRARLRLAFPMYSKAIRKGCGQ